MRRRGAQAGSTLVMAGLAWATACGDVEPLAPIATPTLDDAGDSGLPATDRDAREDDVVADTGDDGTEHDETPTTDDAVVHDDDITPPAPDDGCPLAFATSQPPCDESLGTWVPTTGRMQEDRIAPAVVKLPDGRVLVVGGYRNSPDGYGPTNATAELYDPATDAFTPTSSMIHPRAAFTASLLPDGSVLAVGGITSTSSDGGFVELRDAERWDPASGRWTALGDVLPAARAHHTADVLHDGRVLLLGGKDILRGRDVEIVSGAGMEAASTTRYLPGLPGVTLHGGTTIIGVGTLWRSDNPYGEVDVALGVIDRASGRVRGVPLRHARFMPQATARVDIDGTTRALLVGVDAQRSDEAHPWGRPIGLIVDDGIERETRHAPLCWRNYPTAATLLDGRALVIGGSTLNGHASSGELFDPADESFVSTCPMVHPRSLHASVVLDDGSVLAVGGVVTFGQGTVAERFIPGTR